MATRRVSPWPLFWLWFAVGAAAILLVHTCHGGELEECRKLAPKYAAELEARQWDGTRVDLLTETHAIEVDWPKKWAEAIGQAAYYAELTGKRPGVLLLVSDFRAEARYIYRAQTVCARLRFDLFLERVEPEQKQPTPAKPVENPAAADRRRDEPAAAAVVGSTPYDDFPHPPPEFFDEVLSKPGYPLPGIPVAERP